MNQVKRNNRKKVLIIDDHRMVTQGLSILLKKESSLEVCETAPSFQEGWSAIQNHLPDVVLVDLHLGDGNGFELIRKVSTNYKSIHPIVLSSKDETIMAGRCIQAGAKGYVMKDKPFEVIVNAIKTVLAGQLYLSESIKQQMIELNTRGGENKGNEIDRLSDREFEIFLLISEGLQQKQISEKLCISTVTVNTHCQNIKSKLHLDSMRDVIAYSIKWLHNEA